MLDRLEELKTLTEGPQRYQPPLLTPPQSSPYFQKLKLAQHCLYKAKKATVEIQNLKKTFSTTASVEEESSVKTKLRSLLDFTNQEFEKVRKISEALSNDLENHKDGEDVDSRLKITMHATLMKQFQDAIAEHELTQNDFHEYARGKISGQLRMIHEEIDEETIERCIEDPKLAQKLVEDQIIGGHTDIISMVNRIEDRLEDIKMLEQNITIMHKMFLDLATLVENQGEILNSIESHVDKAREYVIQGTQAIERAEEQFRAARWKKCCVMLIILVIAIVITVPIVTVKYM